MHHAKSLPWLHDGLSCRQSKHSQLHLTYSFLLNEIKLKQTATQCARTLEDGGAPLHVVLVPADSSEFG